MELTLRKANTLVKNLLEAARKLPLERTTSLSAFLEVNPQDVVDMAAEKLRENLSDGRALTSAAFELRGQIGSANAAGGINTLLTERANLDAQEKLVAGVAEGSSHGFDVDTAPARLAALKDRLANPNSYESQDSLALKVTPDASLKDDLLVIRRRKVQIADELLAKNTSITISVSPSTQALLDRFKLV
jgi:hypothetical protein